MRKIGKRMGRTLYLHISAIGSLSKEIQEAIHDDLERFAPWSDNVAIVKVNYEKDTISYFVCKDFDTAHEPTQNDGLLVNQKNGRAKWLNPPTDPWVYHDKWLMVGDNYTGFDIQAARERTQEVNQFPQDKSRIGKKSFWLNWLKEVGLNG